MKHARKKKKRFRKNVNYGVTFCTNPAVGVGGGVLRCIATALRGLGHQSRREVVRSDDKFVEQYDNIIKSWVTWIMRAIYPGDPPWVGS